MLGRPVFAVGPEADIPDARSPAFWYAKVDVGDAAAVARLEARGFRVVDVNVTLRHDADRAAGAGEVEVGPANPDEYERLVEIAGSCFRYSRFHLDPAIPNSLADRVKREWLRSYVEGSRGIELLAARSGERPIGFLAVLEAGTTRVIDLVGVAREAQGRGAGGALVAAFVERHGPLADELRVGTQIANVPSLRLYARHGFAVLRAAYVLHRHGEPA